MEKDELQMASGERLKPLLSGAGGTGLGDAGGSGDGDMGTRGQDRDSRA